MSHQDAARTYVPGPFGLVFTGLTRDRLLDHVFAALERGEGGVLLTANLDILRRSAMDMRARDVYAHASICIADGMPIVWASRIAGSPLPERIAGASLILPLAERAAREGRSLYLLGGEGADAEAATNVLTQAHSSLSILGTSSPRVSDPPTGSEVDAVLAQLAQEPDVVFVAMGSPKQEALAVALHERLPRTWFIGVGGSFAFLAGRIERAPTWAQELGLEWVHRLLTEPRRLGRRYLVDDLPFAAVLFAYAVRDRLRCARCASRSSRDGA